MTMNPGATDPIDIRFLNSSLLSTGTCMNSDPYIPPATSERTQASWEFPHEAYALLRHPSYSSASPSTSKDSLFPDVPGRQLSSKEETEYSYGIRQRLGDLRPVYELRGWRQPDAQSVSSYSSLDNEQDRSDQTDFESSGKPTVIPASETSKLVEYRGRTRDAWTDQDESGPYITPASSPQSDENLNLNDIGKKKVTWTDDLSSDSRNLQNCLPRQEKARIHHGIPIRTPEGKLLTFDNGVTTLHVGPPRPQVPLHLQSSSLPSAKYLLPSAITPAPATVLYDPNKPTIVIKPHTIQPINIFSRGDKKLRIINGLLSSSADTSFLLSTKLDSYSNQYGGNVSEDGIHIFVDSSNITINFQQVLRNARKINPHDVVKRAPISFHSLALIMERGRPVAKRVLVGSSGRSDRVPDYMRQAERCGYEVSNLARVEKLKLEQSVKRPRGGTGSGYGTGSGSEGPTGLFKVTEQGVDEILHLKMMESLYDYEPSTLVLATGDAAEAEYSGGFLLMIERAMRNGWKVELVAWKQGMSFAYRSKEFLAKWEDQFTILYLDRFAEDLLSVYAN